MTTLTLNQIDAGINQLSIDEQLLLLERLAGRIRAATMRKSPFEVEMEMMANDTEIQREVRQIDAEFAYTELDGLADETW